VNEDGKGRDAVSNSPAKTSLADKQIFAFEVSVNVKGFATEFEFNCVATQANRGLVVGQPLFSNDDVVFFRGITEKGRCSEYPEPNDISSKWDFSSRG
jgi:hypothetical protein